MLWSLRSRHTVVVAAALLAVVAACSAPDPPAAGPASAAPTPGPIAVYTLEKPEHRNPVPIVWHADSGTFFVGTMHDGTVYRGTFNVPAGNFISGVWCEHWRCSKSQESPSVSTKDAHIRCRLRIKFAISAQDLRTGRSSIKELSTELTK